MKIVMLRNVKKCVDCLLPNNLCTFNVKCYLHGQYGHVLKVKC